MKFLRWLTCLLFSQKGEDESKGQASGQGEDSAVAVIQKQGDQNSSAQEPSQGQAGQEGQEGQSQPTLEELIQELENLKQSHEILKGQSGATERNLAAERKAIEAMGLKIVRDSEGNVQLLPQSQANKNSRFTNQHKTKFSSYFPDETSANGFLELMNLYLADFFEQNISQYDRTLFQRQQFMARRDESIKKMFQLYPSLNPEHESYNKVFYERADAILAEKYSRLPNGDLIAAHEAALEMGISPAAIQQAKAQGYQKAQTQRKIVGTVQGSQGQAQTGFRKLSREEYLALSPEKREAYAKREIENRGK